MLRFRTSGYCKPGQKSEHKRPFSYICQQHAIHSTYMKKNFHSIDSVLLWIRSQETFVKRDQFSQFSSPLFFFFFFFLAKERKKEEVNFLVSIKSKVCERELEKRVRGGGRGWVGFQSRPIFKDWKKPQLLLLLPWLSASVLPLYKNWKWVQENKQCLLTHS